MGQISPILVDMFTKLWEKVLQFTYGAKYNPIPQVELDMDKSAVSVSSTGSDRPGYPVTSPPWWKIGGRDYAYASIDGDLLSAGPSTSSSDTSLDESAVIKRRHSIFQAAEAEQLYTIPDDYEGKHRFDPTFEWTADEEKALVRKVRSKSTCLVLTMY